MAAQQDAIEIIITAKTDEAEKARKALEGMGQQVVNLKADFDAGKIGLAQYTAGLDALTARMDQARITASKLEMQVRDMGGKMTGATRSSAMFQGGMFVANTAQDVIQGGPASGINNILGAAGNSGIRALAAEGIAAAGGIGVVATALGTVAIAAGAAFLVIDQGLKSANLEWSDFDDVVSNLGPVNAFTEAMSGIGVIAKEWGITDAITGTFGAIAAGIGYVADYTLGWSAATDAARTHKAELERGVQAAHDYADAVKGLKGVKSDEQEEAAKRGKLVGGELADLGRGGGLPGLATDLAKRGTTRGADDKVKVQESDEKGNVSEVEVTRLEAARRDIFSDINRAREGNTDALGRLMIRLKTAGYDTSKVEAAAAGRDTEKEAKDAKTKAEKDAREAKEKAERDAKQATEAAAKRADELAKPLQDRYNLGRANGNPIDEAVVRKELTRAGVTEADAGKFARPVLGQLREGYDEEIRKRSGAKGLDAEGARASIVTDARAKLDKEAKEKAERDRASERQAQSERVREAERLAAGSGLRERATMALSIEAMKRGSIERAQVAVSEQFARELAAKGMGANDARLAAKDIIGKEANKLGDEATARVLSGKGPMEPVRFNTPERIDVGSFARSVESAGMDIDRKQLTALEAMKEQLTELVRLGRGPARLGR